MIDASLYKGTDLAKSGKDFKTITSMKSMGKTKSGARVKEITLGDMSTDRAPKSKTATFLENIAAKHLPLKTRVENIKWNTDLGRDIFGIYNKSVQGYYERNIIQPKVRQEILKSEKPQLGAADSESHGPKHLGDVARNIKTDYAKLKETNPNVRLSPFKEISDDKYADLLGQFHDAAKVGAKEIPGIDHGVAAARAIVAKRTGDSFVDSQMTDAQRLQLAKDLAYHDTQQPWSSGDLPAAVKTTLGRTSTAAKLLSNADREDLTRFGIKPNKFKMFNVGYWDTTKQDISGVPRTVLDTTKTVVSGTSKGIANMMANTSASASFGGLGTSSNKSGSSTRANSNGNAAPKSSSVDVNNIVSKGTEMKSTNASLLSDITSRVDSQSSLDGLLTNTSGLTPTDKNALNVLQNVTDANRNARTFVTVKTPDGRAIKTNDVDQASQLVSRSGGKVVGIDSIDTRAQDIQTTINKLTSNFNSEASNMTVAQKKAAKAELDATISKLKQDAKIINTENKNNVSGDSLVGKGKAVSNKQEVKQPINSYADKQSLIEEMAGSKKLPTNETSGKIPTKEDDQETLYNALTGEKNKPEYPSSYESTKPENGYEYLVKKNNKDYDYKPQAKKEYGYLPQSKKDYGYLPQAKTEYKEPYAKTEYKEPYAKTEYKEPYQKADYKEPYKTDYKEPYPRTEYRDPYDYVQSKYPTGKYPAGNYPSGKYPTGSYPAGKYPSGSYPTGKYQAGVYPAGNYPGDSYPGGNYPSDKKIASLYPVGGKHIDDKPREEKKRKIEEVHRFPRRDLEADADKLVVRTKVQTFREAMSGKSITTPTLDTSDDLLTGESRVPPTTKSKITTGSNVGTFRDMVNGNVKSGMPKQPARTTPKQPPKQPPKQATNQISKIDMNKLSTGVQNKIKAIQKEHKTQGKPKIGTNEKPVKVTESNMALGKFMGFTPTTKQTKTKKDGKNSGMLNGLL
jgi:hypothetical protein